MEQQEFDALLKTFLMEFSGMEQDNFLGAVPDIQDSIETLAKAYAELHEGDEKMGVDFSKDFFRGSAKFVSEWEDGSEVVTSCYYDEETGEVSEIEQDYCNVDRGCLEREYVRYYSSDMQEEWEANVCQTCHNHVMKSVMTEGPFHSYDEKWVCCDPDCESNN